MPSCCSGTVTYFDVLVVGATVAGISAMLSAVSYGGQVALVDENAVHVHLKQYFERIPAENHLDSFDLRTYDEVVDDISVHLLEGTIILLPDKRIRIDDFEYQYDRLVLACETATLARIGIESHDPERCAVQRTTTNLMHPTLNGIWVLSGQRTSLAEPTFESQIRAGIGAGEEAARVH